MSMSGNDRGDNFYNALKAQLGWSPSAEDDQKARDFWRAAFTADTSYIQSNAEVSSNGATGVGPVGGPLPIAGLPGSVL